MFGKSEDYPKEFHTSKCEIIDLDSYDKTEFVSTLYELRRSKGMTIENAQTLLEDPVYFAMMMLKCGLADGVVAGAKYSTADVLRPALQIIKTKPSKKIVTGSMLMIKEGVRPLLFGDVSLIVDPTAEELAEIAIDNAELMEKLLGQTPKVAMLSYSTLGSAKGEKVEKVQSATRLAQANSKYFIDGEMQVDSALDLSTAKKKQSRR